MSFGADVGFRKGSDPTGREVDCAGVSAPDAADVIDRDAATDWGGAT
jgi:hypothetical protein